MRTDFAGSGEHDLHDANGIVLGPAPRDKIGQRVDVGSFIAYGHALGRCAGLRVGLVLALGRTEPPAWRTNDGPGWKATVIGIDDDWEHRPVQVCDRIGTLFFPNRWLVLDPETLPATYRSALDAYVWPAPKTKKTRAKKTP
jgi:hypothetical protein